LTASARRVQVWNLDTGKELGLALEHPAEVLDLATGPARQGLLTSCADRMVRLWDLKTGKVTGGPWEPGEPNGKGALSPSGTLALVWTATGKFRIWEVAAGKEWQGQFNHIGDPGMAFVPRSSTFWCVVLGGVMRFSPGASLEEMLPWPSSYPVTRVA